MVHAHLRYSTKPFMGGVTSPEGAQDSIDMARLVFGAAFMETNAVIQANINVNSPLVYDHTMSGALRIYAAANQCVAVSPAIFGGAMGPVSQAAVLAQTLAEGMAGIALAQLVRPGCPVVLGSFHTTMNLKSGALTFGSPEANLATMALAQLGRRLGVPVRSGGGQITSSNAADGQAMQDSTSAMWATVLSGTHQVWHAAGWLEGGLTIHPGHRGTSTHPRRSVNAGGARASVGRCRRAGSPTRLRARRRGPETARARRRARVSR